VTYEIEYSPHAVEHLASLTKRQQQIVVDEVDRQLVHAPATPTRKRKRLRPNLLADWELRIGDLRVYYVVQEPPKTAVSILAVGRKAGNRVFVGGEELIL
jgi:mRNA-degrading endonuclease RelE of RelBE toxin-antitoxin system